MTGIAPEAASAVERGMDETSAARVTTLPHTLPQTAWDAERIPPEWLPPLAWAVSVDLWDADWSAELQRAAIAGAREQHRLKGTPAGLKRALDHIGAAYEIIERPGGARFRVSVRVLNLDSIALSSLARLTATINRMKRASVHVAIEAEAGASLDISFAMGAGAAAYVAMPARLVINEAGGAFSLASWSLPSGRFERLLMLVRAEPSGEDLYRDAVNPPATGTLVSGSMLLDNFGAVENTISRVRRISSGEVRLHDNPDVDSLDGLDEYRSAQLHIQTPAGEAVLDLASSGGNFVKFTTADSGGRAIIAGIVSDTPVIVAVTSGN